MSSLGEAVLNAWGGLPADVQHDLFEAAVVAGARRGATREQLAQLLHDVHPRTG